MPPMEKPSAAKPDGKTKGFDYTPRAVSEIGLEIKNVYSRVVFWLKIILPAMAVALLLMIMVWPKVDSDSSHFHLEPQNVAKEAPTSSVIVGPRYVGSTGNGVTYSIRADAAAPAPSDPNAINLQKLQIDLSLQNMDTVHLNADRATYWRDRNGMTAHGNIYVQTAEDQEIFTETAYADFAKGIIWGEAPISGRSPNGQFTAQGFEAAPDSGMIKLKGRTQMTLQPKSPRPTKKPLGSSERTG